MKNLTYTVRNWKDISEQKWYETIYCFLYPLRCCTYKYKSYNPHNNRLKFITFECFTTFWAIENYWLFHHSFLVILFFLSVAQQANSGPSRLIVEVSRSHTPGRTPPNEQSARRRLHYLHSTQQTQETNMHALSGIRTRDLRNQADADLHITPHGHRDGFCCNFVVLSFVLFSECWILLSICK